MKTEMSTDFKHDVNPLEPEAVSDEMIHKAVESCLATAGGGPERALELAAPEHAIAIGDADDDQAEPQEV